MLLIYEIILINCIMSGNSFGKLFKLTTFGESHGKIIGGIIDGCPSGIKINIKKIQYQLNRRKPGQTYISTPRKENDKVKFLSGILNNITLGTPIGFIIKNNNVKSNDYNYLKSIYRPSHADFTYEKKYGIRDHRGGGRSSARETACRIVAGAIARQILKNIKVIAYVSSIGNIKINKSYNELNLSKIDDNIVRCPDTEIAKKMIRLINKVKENGDTLGGCITCIIKNTPIGLGDPVFDKLQANLAKAMLSINSTKGFEYGSGFYGSKMLGSEHNDEFKYNGITKTNNSGGILGGISNGMDIYFKIAFKPIATIMKKQKTIDNKNNEIYFTNIGRHDTCVLPRAVPIVESMTYIVLLNHWLINNIYDNKKY